MSRRRALRCDRHARREISKRLHVLRRDSRRLRAAQVTKSSIAQGSLRQWREKARGSRQLPRQSRGPESRASGLGDLVQSSRSILC